MTFIQFALKKFFASETKMDQLFIEMTTTNVFHQLGFTGENGGAVVTYDSRASVTIEARHTLSHHPNRAQPQQIDILWGIRDGQR